MTDATKLDQPFILVFADEKRLPMLLNVNQIAVVRISDGATHLHMSSGQDIHVTGAAAELFMSLAQRSVSLTGDPLAGVMQDVLKELERKD